MVLENQGQSVKNSREKNVINGCVNQSHLLLDNF